MSAIEDNIIKDIKNLLNVNTDKIIIDIRTLFKSDEKDHYELARICNAFSSNCIEHYNEDDKNKTLKNILTKLWSNPKFEKFNNILIRLDHILVKW